MKINEEHTKKRFIMSPSRTALSGMLFTFLLLIAIMPVSATLQDGLVGYFAFDNNNFNSAVNGHSFVNDGTSNIQGKLVDARYLNGSNASSLQAFSINPVIANKTYNFWININSSGAGFRVLWASDSGALFGSDNIALTAANFAQCNFGDGFLGGSVATGTTTLANNTWYMISCIANPANNRLELYVNGAVEANVSYTFVGGHSSSMRLFNRVDGFGFNGIIDEFAVYNRSLSGSEISSLYNSGSAYNPFLVSSSEFTYGVKQKDTFKNISIQEIRANFNTAGGFPFSYAYAVACDISSSPYWNEQFRNGYNGSDYSASFLSTDGLLSNAGLRIDIPTNMSYFYFEKFRGVAIRADSKLAFSYSSADNVTFDLLALNGVGGLSDIMLYYRFMKNGSNVSVYAVEGHQTPPTYLGSILAGDNIAVSLDLVPVIIADSKDFLVTITVNNQTVANDVTRFYNWNNGNTGDIGNVQLYSYTTGVTQLHSLGFFKSPSSVGPPKTNFINSYWYNEGRDLFYAPPQSYINQTVNNLRILGEGYSVIPGWLTNETTQGFTFSQILEAPILVVPVLLDPFGLLSTYVYGPLGLNTDISSTRFYPYGGNNVFYSECSYDAPGVYTQRHYLFPGSSVDLTVVVSGRDTGAGGVPSIFDVTAPSEGIIGGDLPPEENEIFGNLFDGTVFDSVGGRLLFWIVLTGIIAALCFSIHPGFGLLSIPMSLVLGVVLGMVPLWVVIVLVIICGAIIASMYRWLFAGD